jgi:nicotinamide-nucleotide amidase
VDPVEVLAAAGRGGVRVAVAESLTCGRLASAVGRGKDAEDWFAGGVVAYRLDTKLSVLGVRPCVDPCSAECATQMAVGVRWLLSADVAVPPPGWAVRNPKAAIRPARSSSAGQTSDACGHERLSLSGDPDDVLSQTVARALALLVHRATAGRDAPG